MLFGGGWCKICGKGRLKRVIFGVFALLYRVKEESLFFCSRGGRLLLYISIGVRVSLGVQ